MIDYGKFRKALCHLELQYENYRTLGEDQPQLIRDAGALLRTLSGETRE